MTLKDRDLLETCHFANKLCAFQICLEYILSKVTLFGEGERESLCFSLDFQGRHSWRILLRAVPGCCLSRMVLWKIRAGVIPASPKVVSSVETETRTNDVQAKQCGHRRARTGSVGRVWNVPEIIQSTQ